MSPSTKNPPRASPWLKRILIPFWTIQLFLTLVLISVTGLLAASATVGAPLGIAIIYTFLDAICILLLLSEIILFARHTLHPGTYLVLQVVKSTIWTVVFVVYVVRLATIKGPGLAVTNPLALFLGGDLEAIVLLLAFIGSLIYASIIYYRARRSRQRLRAPTPDPATDYDGRTAPPQYASSKNHAPEDEQRLELPERGEEGQRGMRIGVGGRRVQIGEGGRREELEGEGGVYELDAGGQGRGWRVGRGGSGRSEGRRAELRG